MVGLGLMGGSLARAVRARLPAIELLAVEPDAPTREAALREEVVDVALAELGAELGRCDLAVLCTPILAIERLLGPVSRLLPDGAVLTDVGGAKERLHALAEREVRAGVLFVGAHPMFGGHGGFAGSRANLWQGGAVAVCTEGDRGAVERVAALHAALGATVVRCGAAEHDAAVARVSHLPYLLASALALSAREAGPLASQLAGPGLRDMTRLAQFPFDIQGEVARRNAHLPASAEALTRELARLLAAVGDSPESARAALEEARAAREALYPAAASGVAVPPDGTIASAAAGEGGSR